MIPQPDGNKKLSREHISSIAAALAGVSAANGVSLSPFNHSGIRDWLFGSIGIPDPLMAPSTTGSGPFEEADFDAFLDRYGILPMLLDEDTTIVVVGREGWDAELLEGVIKSRQGQTLRVYSQEMFLCYWITYIDPLEAPEEVIDAFRKGHPALEYISEGWPGWVSTIVPAHSSGTLAPEWPQVGLLKHMGYQVGSNGLPPNERRGILRTVFESEVLPNVESPEYMQQWASPRSAARLLKIANSIAMFCCNNKRKRNSSGDAIADWESDLRWLRQEFYDGRFSFEWPDWE